MKIIKKLDLFILKAYLQLFAGTFFICLFIFLMQAVWRYVDELIGKGLSTDVLAKFLWYSALTIIPMSLPLAILLASLISFGNFGERFELLSMKAAGIPLVRVLRPVFLLAIVLCGCSFYFQNRVSPEATMQLHSLLYSMREKSPELEIPEGIFYSDIPGYNIFVEKKDPKTGMLYGVMIYANGKGYEDTEIVLADSARLRSTDDHMYLKLSLYGGERFRNMDSNGGNMLRANVPYMRESFVSEEDLISFDTNLNLLDANLFSRDARTKGYEDILRDLDSLYVIQDSIGLSDYTSISTTYLRKTLPPGTKDSLQLVRQAAKTEGLDSIYAGFSESQKATAWRNAVTFAEAMNAEAEFRADVSSDVEKQIIKHKMEAQKKFTLSLACLLFFFIGAPLGAIIRKGGLGVPVVVSILIFVLYYIINAAGENNAKTGKWAITFGIWLSSMILLPIGLFLINRANKDSVVFNIEGYKTFFQRLLGLRSSRKLNRKEVIIVDPDYPVLRDALQQLGRDCEEYSASHHLRSIPNYLALFFRYREDRHVAELNDRMESLIEQLHNSRDNQILAWINDYPIISPDAHTRPFRNARLNMAVGILLPLGLFFYFRIWRYRLRLWRDMQLIRKVSSQISDRIIAKKYDQQAEPTAV